MNPYPARHLVIMAKMPQMGRVKTRLAKGIGEVAAWAFYRNQLGAVMRRLGRDRRWQTWLAVAPDRALGAPCWPDNLNIVQFAQGAGDLGQRMARIMQGLPPGPAIIVGCDIPGLSAGHVAQGFRCLGGHDAVFGPATDGGYYLVGLKRHPKTLDLFDHVRWSGPHALVDTVANLGGTRVAYIGELADVDTAADLAALKT